MGGSPFIQRKHNVLKKRWSASRGENYYCWVVAMPSLGGCRSWAPPCTHICPLYLAHASSCSTLHKHLPALPCTRIFLLYLAHAPAHSTLHTHLPALPCTCISPLYLAHASAHSTLHKHLPARPCTRICLLYPHSPRMAKLEMHKFCQLPKSLNFWISGILCQFWRVQKSLLTYSFI